MIGRRRMYQNLRPKQWAAIASVLLTFKFATALAAQIPPTFISSVVAIGSQMQVQGLSPGEPPHLGWFTEGTGFFYGYMVQDDPDPLKRQYEIYLVTARHVVEGHASHMHTDLSVRVDAKDASKGATEFSIPSTGAPTWFYHPNKDIDVAATLVNMQALNAAGFEPGWFASDMTAADTKKLKELEASAGDSVYVLGFPMNLAGEQRNYVIAREGVIARISEMLDGASKQFMVDSLVFPGNSGGPVVLKPEPFSIIGTKNNSAAYLIGVVLSYLPYSETAISEQTLRPRIRFEENSGLAEILPVDYINEAIASWRAANLNTLPRKKEGSPPDKAK